MLESESGIVGEAAFTTSGDFHVQGFCGKCVQRQETPDGNPLILRFAIILLLFLFVLLAISSCDACLHFPNFDYDNRYIIMTP